MYGSIIWSPNNRSMIYSLEKIQNKYLKFLSWKTNTPMSYFDHDYDNILKTVNLISLEKARFKNEIIFIYKLVNGYIDCPALVERVKVYKPINPLRTVKFNNIFEIYNDKIQYSIIQKKCQIININKEWIIIKDITLFQILNLIFKNINKQL